MKLTKLLFILLISFPSISKIETLDRIAVIVDDGVLMESQILNIAGVVQVGLFNDMCDVVVLANDGKVTTLVNPEGRL